MIKCKKCGAVMWRAPIVLTSYPAKYQYNCPCCDNIEYLYEKDDDQVLVNIYKKDNVLVILYYNALSKYFDIVLDSADTIIDSLEIYSGEK